MVEITDERLSTSGLGNFLSPLKLGSEQTKSRAGTVVKDTNPTKFKFDIPGEDNDKKSIINKNENYLNIR